MSFAGDAQEGAELLLSSLGQDARLCLVSRDQALLEALPASLGGCGFAVYTRAEISAAALEALAPDLVILDGLPWSAGSETLFAGLRRGAAPGLVVLCAEQSTRTQRIQTLLAGADACLEKPFVLAELVATLVSIQRRLLAGQQAAEVVHAMAVEECGGWRLSGDGWLLSTPCRHCIRLTRAERGLLRVLFRHPDTVLSRSLLEGEGASQGNSSAHRLDMVISRLRGKVLNLTGAPLPLVAVRGEGFMFQGQQP